MRKPRPSSIPDPVRHQVLGIARDHMDGWPHVHAREVLGSDDDHPLAPVEANALRILVDGWAASLHRTVIPVLIHLDGDGSRDVRRAVEDQLGTARSSQITRSTRAHHAGLTAPVRHDPFHPEGVDPPPVDVDHLDGQRHEMDHLLAVGGPDLVRMTYGTLARDLLVRRSAGVSRAYAGGTMVETEISARIAIGDRGELRGNVLIVTDAMPDTVAEAARGRPLHSIAQVPGIGHHVIEDVARHAGNASSQGLKRVDHTRITLRGPSRTGIAGHLARHTGR